MIPNVVNLTRHFLLIVVLVFLVLRRNHTHLTTSMLCWCSILAFLPAFMGCSLYEVHVMSNSRGFYLRNKGVYIIHSIELLLCEQCAPVHGIVRPQSIQKATAELTTDSNFLREMSCLGCSVFLLCEHEYKSTLHSDVHMVCLNLCAGEVFDYLVAHGRMKEKEARVKFRQVKE